MRRSRQDLVFKKHGGKPHFEDFESITVIGGENITIGRRCHFCPHVYLHGTGGITMGNYVTLSDDVKILSVGLDTGVWTTKASYKNKKHVDKPVFIGDYCWIGVGAIICPGVQLEGKAIIIGAGAVVTKSVEESFVLVAGNPARIVKRYKAK